MKVETHHPFLYITGAFGSGILLNRFEQLPVGILCLLVLVLFMFGAGLSRKALASTALLLLAIVGLGALYTQSREMIAHNDIEHVARYYYRKPITIEGVIVSDIQKRKAGYATKTTFTLDVERVLAKWGWQERKGKILAHVFRDADLAYGDHLRLEGRLHRPYNFSSERNFSYRDYLARRGIRFILSVKKNAPATVLARDRGNGIKAWSLTLRNRLKAVLSGNLSNNEAGIMKAILLGDRSGIPKPVRSLFVQTGTAHILAISGLHMGIVAALFLVLARVMPIGRRPQLALVICLIIGYVFLTGARPSVVRAAVMTVIFLASFIIEKEFDMINTLFLAALAILLINPSNLFDAGFQLSFVCVFAIIFADSNMRRTGLRRSKQMGGEPNKQHFEHWFTYILQSLLLSLAIWIAVAGLIAYYFGIITPITILANIIVVPLISVIVALGFGLLLVGMIVPSWAFLFALCVKVALNVMVGLIFLCDKIPFAHIYIKEISLWPVSAYYAVVFLALFIPRLIVKKMNTAKQLTNA